MFDIDIYPVIGEVVIDDAAINPGFEIEAQTAAPAGYEIARAQLSAQVSLDQVNGNGIVRAHELRSANTTLIQ